MRKRVFNRDAFEHFLQQQEKQELVEQLGDLFERFEVVSDYYKMALRSGRREVLEKYKDKIEDEFIIEDDEGNLLEPDTDKISIILNEFEMLNPKTNHLVEIICFSIELVGDFEEETDEILDDNFYVFFEELLAELLQKLEVQNQLKKFRIYICEIILSIADKSSFREELENIFHDFYDEIK
ncbi:hypothetical protein [Chondrinema litorale]|uniref:hypothetical protein n=1 Tax=Chondrinema litorale TaxID=2994555 RepID=UPI0025439C04|nr:hypothetical protein [Chondrinema litorale]UZR92890.1 hypothetical protein OQ292_13595 [Chondrinema litorale]